jgi:hypothetical protein
MCELLRIGGSSIRGTEASPLPLPQQNHQSNDPPIDQSNDQPIDVIA